jgi:hypothetical protein
MSTSTDPKPPGPSATRSAPPQPEPPISTRGMLIGTIILGVLLLAFAMWANEAGKRAGAEARAVPEIVWVEPAEGALVEGAAAVVFETAADLRPGPAGWEAAGNHIHASVDGVELMPGAGDISRLDTNRYQWVIRPLAPGFRELQLFWSDRRHRPIEEGASRTVRIESR